MAYQSDLSVRHQNILKATIKHYIATAEPVASKTLAREYNFNVSSATIRNIMGSLEEAGLLYQPHVSAGRVPSDSGYRIYVDRLIVPNNKITKTIQKSLQQELQVARASFEALLQRSAKILAALSGYIALITFPRNLNSTVRHLQLVRVATSQVMLIVVTDSLQTQSILMESPLSSDEVEESMIESELQILSNFLDRQLKGRSIREIATLDWAEINREFAQYTDFFSILLDRFKLAFQANNSSPILIHGVAEFLRHPEFSQLQQVQTLLSLLEQPEQLLPVIFTFPEVEDSLKRINIKIGEENHLEPMQTCTLISANYYQDDTPVGSVGILGPKRMLYENAIALVENTADYLSNSWQV
ncbi:MAG: heat-inducible transcriptional repressor HrcA [Pleurocapsa sp. MO_226.B13]|nr:heat-inducible transcriptional repressor HrcA [Pleurocapsa sp. MO_226.B13]